MRILFVSNFYPPDSLGGVQLYTHGLAVQLKNLGHEVQVICVGNWDSGTAAYNGVTNDVHEGIPVRRVHLNWRLAPEPFRFLYNNPFSANAMGKILAEFKPDVVHVTSCANLSASVIFTARDHHIPVVLTLADYWFICPRFTLQHGAGHICDAAVTAWECLRCLSWGAKIYRWPGKVLPQSALQWLLVTMGKNPFLSRQRGLIGLVGDMADRRQTLQRAFDCAEIVLAISHHLREVFIKSEQLSGSKIHVHEWGLPSMEPNTQKELLSGNSLRLAYFGRLTPSKGVHILLDAFHKLSGNIKLHLYGTANKQNTDYAEQLKNMAANSSRILFHGAYQRSDMSTLLQQTDLVIVPSIWPETYNLVAREALLAHVPVVASNIGALTEAVQDQQNGILFEPGNADELAVILQRLINNPELLVNLTSQAPQIKTIEQEVNELLSLYRTIIT